MIAGQAKARNIGFKVLRFWNHDVFLRFDAVLEQLRLNVEL